MTNFILFIILFGILVFIHEFGHFIVAKKTGVFVEKFFLGWGPKIFSFRRGETEYGVNWVPLGGYVKLAGEDPTEKKAEVPADRMFMSKTPLQRIAIVGAGPVSNLILPIILFALLYFVGIPALGPVIGEVISNSPAQMAGLKQGDRVIAINDEEVEKWDDLTEMIRKSEGETVRLKVSRDGKVLTIPIEPELSKVKNIYRETVDGWTVGVTPYQYEPAIGILDENSPAYRSGLRTGDIILAVNGEKIDYFWQIEEILKESSSGEISFKIARGEGKVSKRETLEKDLKAPASVSSPVALGIYPGDLFIAKVKPGTIAAKKGIKEGDRFLSINGKDIDSWIDVEKAIGDNNGDAIKIALMRDNKKIGIELTPQLTSEKDELTGAQQEKRELGIEPNIVMKDPIAVEVREQTFNPFKAVMMGIAKTYLILKTQIIGFGKLIQGKLSVKHIGGPIMIYKFAGGSWQVGGIFSFISAIALLSIVLGFVNLLPIPILDGGHILFYSIELIKRKPLSIRTREIAQQFGFLIIIGLLLLATYNDINRYFWRHIVEFFKNIF